LDKPVARIPQALKPRRPRPEVPARGRSRAQSGSPTPEQTIASRAETVRSKLVGRASRFGWASSVLDVKPCETNRD